MRRLKGKRSGIEKENEIFTRRGLIQKDWGSYRGREGKGKIESMWGWRWGEREGEESERKGETESKRKIEIDKFIGR